MKVDIEYRNGRAIIAGKMRAAGCDLTLAQHVFVGTRPRDIRWLIRQKYGLEDINLKADPPEPLTEAQQEQLPACLAELAVYEPYLQEFKELYADAPEAP